MYYNMTIAELPTVGPKNANVRGKSASCTQSLRRRGCINSLLPQHGDRDWPSCGIDSQVSGMYCAKTNIIRSILCLQPLSGTSLLSCLESHDNSTAVFG